MLVLLPDEKSLLAELSMYLKTDHYIRVRRNEEADENERSILREKGESNQKRRKQIRDSIEDLLKSAKLIVVNKEIEINGDALSRLREGFQQLVRSTYPNLEMLNPHPNYQETDLNRYLFDDTQDLFTSGGITEFTEAEEDIISVLAQTDTSGERTTFKDISDYYMTSPKPEPIQLLFLSTFLFYYKKYNMKIDSFYWVFLGLAFGAKISLLPLVIIFLLPSVFHAIYQKKIYLLLEKYIVGSYYFILGLGLAVPILLPPIFISIIIYKLIIKLFSVNLYYKLSLIFTLIFTNLATSLLLFFKYKPITIVYNIRNTF